VKLAIARFLPQEKEGFYMCVWYYNSFLYIILKKNKKNYQNLERYF
jgi:hypothetical protein